MGERTAEYGGSSCDPDGRATRVHRGGCSGHMPAGWLGLPDLRGSVESRARPIAGGASDSREADTRLAEALADRGIRRPMVRAQATGWHVVVGRWGVESRGNHRNLLRRRNELR